MEQYNEETGKGETYTPNGRNIDNMGKNEIIDYLGLNDNINNDINDKLYYEIIEQAEAVEKAYKSKMIDYCLKRDYESYIKEYTDIIIAETRDLIIFIKQ